MVLPPLGLLFSWWIISGIDFKWSENKIWFYFGFGQIMEGIIYIQIGYLVIDCRYTLLIYLINISYTTKERGKITYLI